MDFFEPQVLFLLLLTKRSGNERFRKMKKSTGKGKEGVDYPKRTRGSKMAAKLRKKANAMSEAEIGAHYEKAIAVVYAGRRRQTASA
jgi:hypothetical protein